MAEAVLFVELVPTASGVKRGIEKDLNGSFDAAEKKGTSVFSKIGGLAKGAAIAAGAAAAAITGLAIKGGFERMLKIEDAQAKRDGLGHSAETVDLIMGSALASVKGTAYGLDTAATVAASAVAAGIKPGQELEKYLRLTADAATIAGISMDEMGSIMNKVQANGRAMTENLNQLQDRGIPILQWLAEEYGVAADEMSKMVSQGKVDAETFNRVIEENIGGAALRSGETTRGAWANMLAALSRVGVALLEDVFPYFKDTFNGITVLLDNVTDKISPFSDKVSGLLTLLRTGDFTGEIRELTGWEEDSPIVGAIVRIHDAVSGLFDLITNGDYTSALRDAFGWEEDSPFVAFLLDARDAIMELAPQIFDLVGYFTPLGAAFKLLGDFLPQLLTPLLQIGEVLIGLATAALPIVSDLFGTLSESLGGVLVQVLPVVAALLAVVADTLEQAMPVVAEVAAVVGQVLAVALEALGPILSVVLALLRPLMTIFSTLVPVVLGVVSAILPLVTMLVTALAPILVTVAELVGAVLMPVLDVLADVFTMLAPVIQALVEVAVIQLTATLAFLIPIIEGVVNALASYLIPIVETLMNVLSGIIDFLVNVFTGNWEGAWEAVVGIFASIFDGMQDMARGAINAIIDLINGMLAGISGVGSFLSDITGGTIGFEVGQIPRLEDGALVKARTGGIIANIGEGRYDEAVLPLSPAVLGQLGGSGGTVNVYPQPGMSEMEIGRAAARENARLYGARGS